MSQAFGFNHSVGWAKETTYGTPVTPPVKWIEVESESIKADRKRIVKPLLGHVSQIRTVKDKMSVGGSFKAPLLWEGMEQLLEAAIGVPLTTGPSGSIYTHTYDPQSVLPVGLTLQINRDSGNIGGSTAFEYSGCQVDKLTLTQEMGGTLDAEFEIVGRTRANVALTAAVFPTYDAIDYAQMTLATINPASANFELPVRKFKMVIDNGLFKDKYRLTGAGFRAGFGRGAQRKVSIEAEMEFESVTAFAYYRDLVATDLRFKWVNGTKVLTITTGTGYFQGEDPSPGDSGPIYMTMVYDALANGSDNTEMQLILENETSSV
jgi:Phage tail tube protein